jgi:hypothetical protein
MSTELESDARKEALAAEADERIKRGAHWEDWMFVGDGLAVGQRKAMQIAGTNRPYGRGYTKAFADWINQRPWAKRYNDTGTRSNLLWCIDHRSEIESWRITLAQNQRDLINHPTTMKRRYEAAHRVTGKDGEDGEAAKKETSHEALKRALFEAEAKIKAMETSARSWGDSLFSIGDTPAAQIAHIIVDEAIRIGKFTKAAQIKAALEKEIAAKKKMGGQGQAG